MKGKYHIEVKNRDASFKFDLYRNITIVRGNSGTGKTTLFDMIADYTRLGAESGVNISCEKNCAALVDIDWKNQLKQVSDSIVFIDEGASYLKTKEFADIIKNTDNYYVIFTREYLHDLPYSVSEIYEIKTSGKYHSFKRLYKSDVKHIYSKAGKNKRQPFEIVLTEDAKSGFQFYENYFKDIEIKCESSASNSAIFGWLKEHHDKARFVEMFGDVVVNEKNWNRLMLGDICEIGSSKRVFEKEYVSQGIPFFRTKEIVELSKGNSISTELFISNEHFNHLKETYGVPKKDDLLISAVGTIGTIWIVNGNFDFYFKDGNLIQIKASTKFNSIFMKQLLSELIANYKKEMSTGTAYSALTIAGLKKMLIYDVPLDLQTQFANFVKQVDKSKFITLKEK